MLSAVFTSYARTPSIGSFLRVHSALCFYYFAVISLDSALRFFTFALSNQHSSHLWMFYRFRCATPPYIQFQIHHLKKADFYTSAL